MQELESLWDQFNFEMAWQTWRKFLQRIQTTTSPSFPHKAEGRLKMCRSLNFRRNFSIFAKGGTKLHRLECVKSSFAADQWRGDEEKNLESGSKKEKNVTLVQNSGHCALHYSSHTTLKRPSPNLCKQSRFNGRHCRWRRRRCSRNRGR